MARYRRRDPLAKDRAKLRDAAIAALADPAPIQDPQELERGMRRVIRRKLADGETIALDDFRLAGLPVKDVEPRFKRVLATVQNSIAMERG